MSEVRILIAQLLGSLAEPAEMYVAIEQAGTSDIM
jgi:hypothetical protein